MDIMYIYGQQYIFHLKDGDYCLWKQEFPRAGRESLPAFSFFTKKDSLEGLSSYI